MKSIKLMFLMIGIGMISFTACSESEQMQEQTKENTIQNKEGDDFVWLELEEGEKRDEVIAAALYEITGVECSDCRGRCKTIRKFNGNTYVVQCDGYTGLFAATNCGGDWHVMYFPRDGVPSGMGWDNVVGYPCP